MGAGLVSFVGLGVADPSLRSQRATERLTHADVVVDGDEPNASRLIALALQGQRVVRAVDGDALESPRIAAEAVEVARAGIAIEIVPGAGARSQAAAFAGVLGRALSVRTS